MPNRHQTLVIKLISIGLAHDLSYLEEIRYDKADRFEEFQLTNKKMFLSLVTLGIILKDYDTRRFCIQAASVVEHETQFSHELLKLLPEDQAPVTVKVESDDDELDRVIQQLRNQLAYFQTAISMNKNLCSIWETTSLKIYENLDLLNCKTRLQEDLKPLMYPGVERFHKKVLPTPQPPATEENGEEVVKIAPPKRTNYDDIMEANRMFNASLSDIFKNLKTKTQAVKIEPTERLFPSLEQIK